MTSRDRHNWVDILNRAVNTTNNCASKFNEELPINRDISIQSTEPDLGYRRDEYINDQVDSELYEEIAENDMSYQRFNSSYENRLSSKIEEIDCQPKYYEVPLEVNDIDTPCLPVTQNINNKKLRKPERPPLPEILKQKMDQSRPLPPEPATKISCECSYDPSIYWEIENDSSFDKDDDTLTSSLHSRSLSQEIFDTIKERVPMLPEDCQSELCRHKKLELLPDNVEYEVPNEVNLGLRDALNGTPDQCEYNISNNSVYQIPTNSWKVCDIYQIPPTPVPVLTITQADLTMSSENECAHRKTPDLQIKLADPNKLEDCVDSYEYKCTSNHFEQINDIEKPLTSVKERIKKINEQQSKTEQRNLRNSLSKKIPGIEKVEDLCIQYQSNSISPISNEIDSTLIDDNDIITLSIQNSDFLSSSTIDVKTGNFVAKFAYVGETPDELSFSRGDTIIVVDASQNTWWEGHLRGKKGYVHREYLRKTDL